MIQKLHTETAAQDQFDQEAVKLHAQEKEFAIRSLRNQEIDELKQAVSETGHRQKEDWSPDSAVAAMLQLLEKKSEALIKARQNREHRKINSAKNLERGIAAIEGATHAISKANRRLIHEFRDPLVL